MRSLMIFIPQPKLLGWKNREELDGRAGSAYEKESYWLLWRLELILEVLNMRSFWLAAWPSFYIYYI